MFPFGLLGSIGMVGAGCCCCADIPRSLRISGGRLPGAGGGPGGDREGPAGGRPVWVGGSGGKESRFVHETVHAIFVGRIVGGKGEEQPCLSYARV